VLRQDLGLFFLDSIVKLKNKLFQVYKNSFFFFFFFFGPRTSRWSSSLSIASTSALIFVSGGGAGAARPIGLNLLPPAESRPGDTIAFLTEGDEAAAFAGLGRSAAALLRKPNISLRLSSRKDMSMASSSAGTGAFSSAGPATAAGAAMGFLLLGDGAVAVVSAFLKIGGFDASSLLMVNSVDAAGLDLVAGAFAIDDVADGFGNDSAVDTAAVGGGGLAREDVTEGFGNESFSLAFAAVVVAAFGLEGTAIAGLAVVGAAGTGLITLPAASELDRVLFGRPLAAAIGWETLAGLGVIEIV